MDLGASMSLTGRDRTDVSRIVCGSAKASSDNARGRKIQRKMQLRMQRRTCPSTSGQWLSLVGKGARLHHVGRYGVCPAMPEFIGTAHCVSSSKTIEAAQNAGPEGGDECRGHRPTCEPLAPAPALCLPRISGRLWRGSRRGSSRVWRRLKCAPSKTFFSETRCPLCTSPLPHAVSNGFSKVGRLKSPRFFAECTPLRIVLLVSPSQSRNSASAPLKPLENRMPTFSNTPRKRKRSLSPTQDAAARSKLARTALRPAATPLPTRVPLPRPSYRAFPHIDQTIDLGA